MSPSRSRLVRTLVLLLALAVTPAVALALETNCRNCVDDDGDGLADRRDPDCASPPANGGGIGIGDLASGKLLTGCAKSVQKAGFKFVIDTMKRFQKCTEAAATCIHAKPGDQGCQAKATAGCAKAVSGFDASAAKLQAVIVGKCDPTGQNIADLRALTGLGFSAEVPPCATDDGVPTLSTIANVASCIAHQHFCRAQHLIAVGTPRAREFLRFAGRLDQEFPCIDESYQGANGAGAGVAADHAKPLLKCSKTIDKASLSLIGSGAKTVQNCLNAGIACIQVAPETKLAACLDKARAKCGAGFAKLQDPVKGTVGKLAAKLTKACSVQANLDLADLVLPNGLGVSAQQGRCTELNDGNTPLPFQQCFGTQAFCEGGYLIEREVPRARELAALLNVQIIGFDD